MSLVQNTMLKPIRYNSSQKSLSKKLCLPLKYTHFPFYTFSSPHEYASKTDFFKTELTQILKASLSKRKQNGTLCHLQQHPGFQPESPRSVAVQERH